LFVSWNLFDEILLSAYSFIYIRLIIYIYMDL